MSSLGKLRSCALRQPLFPRAGPASCSSRLFFRASSLSAIHRGIRSSERAQRGGFQQSRDRDNTDRRQAPSDTSASFDAFAGQFSKRVTSDPDGPASHRQKQKLRKKLEKDAEEDESRRKTRRKRFNDPDYSFGKKSLVYRIKHGDLKDAASSIQLQEPVRPVSFRERKFEARPRRPTEEGFQSRQDGFSRARPERQDSRRSDSTGFDSMARREPRNEEYSARRRRPTEEGSLSRQDGFSRARPERRDSRRSDSTGFDSVARHEPRKEEYSARRGSSTPQQRNYDDEEAGDRSRGPRKEMMAMTVKYTTAASQFLYGRSVVKVALEQGRRKLYNLYIHRGQGSDRDRDDMIMARLAKKHNVPITIIPPEQQRIMDKMSMGRPHNGFVLEASPLPQLPVKSLGRPEVTPTKLGFHVELDFQTKEEEAINGSNTFIERTSDLTPKPFVLLLNEIVDPGNLGGILRTASYLGVDAVCITNRGSSTLTPVVLKSAAGAVEELSLFTVDDAVSFVTESSKAGWKTFAAVAPPDRKLVRRHAGKFISTEAVEAMQPLTNDPCLLILGNEGFGLSKQIKMAADYELSIPRFLDSTSIDSLNVSVAAGLLCHSFVKNADSVAGPVTSETVAEPYEEPEIATPVQATRDTESDDVPAEALSETTREESPREATESKEGESERKQEELESKKEEPKNREEETLNTFWAAEEASPERKS